MLTESRLLTADDETVEVAHEALLREWPRLRGWLEEDAEGRRLHQHLIAASQEWRDSRRDPAELYRGARLASALDWGAEHDPELNELEREFLEESRVAGEREAERQRRTNRRLKNAAHRRRCTADGRRCRRTDRTIGAPERAPAPRPSPTPSGSAPRPSPRIESTIALLLANAGAALDDSHADSLQPSLGAAQQARRPSASWTAPATRSTSVALSPDGEPSRWATWTAPRRSSTPNVAADSATTRRRERCGISTSIDRGPSVAFTASTSAEFHLQGSLTILDARTRGSAGRSFARPASRQPASSPYFPGVAYAPDGRSVVVGYTPGDTDYTAPAAPPSLRRSHWPDRLPDASPVATPEPLVLTRSSRHRTGGW